MLDGTLALCYYFTSKFSSFRPHIYYIISSFYYIQIMFNYNYCISFFYKSIKYF